MSKVEQIKTFYPNELYTTPKFSGTEGDLETLSRLITTPDFNKEYPFHEVFFVKTEVVGAIPGKTYGDPDNQRKRKEAWEALERELERWGTVGVDNCAIALTGYFPLNVPVNSAIDAIIASNS